MVLWIAKSDKTEAGWVAHKKLKYGRLFYNSLQKTVVREDAHQRSRWCPRICSTQSRHWSNVKSEIHRINETLTPWKTLRRLGSKVSLTILGFLYQFTRRYHTCSANLKVKIWPMCFSFFTAGPQPLKKHVCSRAWNRFLWQTVTEKLKARLCPWIPALRFLRACMAKDPGKKPTTCTSPEKRKYSAKIQPKRGVKTATFLNHQQRVKRFRPRLPMKCSKSSELTFERFSLIVWLAFCLSLYVQPFARFESSQREFSPHIFSGHSVFYSWCDPLCHPSRRTPRAKCSKSCQMNIWQWRPGQTDDKIMSSMSEIRLREALTIFGSIRPCAMGSNGKVVVHSLFANTSTSLCDRISASVWGPKVIAVLK